MARNSGVVTASAFTANTTAGTYLVTAATTGLTGDSFTEANLAGAASQVVATNGGGQSKTVGTAFTTLLSNSGHL